MNALQRDAFWQWAVHRYERDTLRERLLSLQDSCGLVVVEALFCVWLSEQGVRLTSAQAQTIRQEIAPWVKFVVVPLRIQRVAWSHDPCHRHYRRALLSLELEAEKMLAELLCAAIEAPETVLAPVPLTANLSLIEQLSNKGDLEALVEAFEQ